MQRRRHIDLGFGQRNQVGNRLKRQHPRLVVIGIVKEIAQLGMVSPAIGGERQQVEMENLHSDLNYLGGL